MKTLWFWFKWQMVFLRIWWIGRKSDERLTGRDWLNMRYAVALRDDFTCAESGKQAQGWQDFYGGKYHVHHINPFSKSKNNSIWNLELVTDEWHRTKHPHMKEGWQNVNRI